MGLKWHTIANPSIEGCGNLTVQQYCVRSLRRPFAKVLLAMVIALSARSWYLSVRLTPISLKCNTD